LYQVTLSLRVTS